LKQIPTKEASEMIEIQCRNRKIFNELTKDIPSFTVVEIR